jgi:hypothetical protein
MWEIKLKVKGRSPERIDFTVPSFHVYWRLRVHPFHAMQVTEQDTRVAKLHEKLSDVEAKYSKACCALKEQQAQTDEEINRNENLTRTIMDLQACFMDQLCP